MLLMGHESTYPFVGAKRVNQTIVTVVAGVPFLLTGLAIYLAWGNHLSWLTVGLWLGMQLIGGMGITLGYHRMLTHKAFKARAPVKAVLLWAGLQALQGGPASWASTHRRHHALADKDGDPHSPLDGLWHAHVGWMLKGNLVHNGPAHDRMMRDPMVRFFEKTQVLWYVLTFLLPAGIAYAVTGSWAAFGQAALWAGAVRVFLMHHTTWSINSICHAWGTRPFDSPDVARNNAIFGVLGFGEGWHNNHHAFPDSAHIGLRWYQFDLGNYVLAPLRWTRLAYDVRLPSKQDRAAKRAAGRAARAARKNPQTA